MRTLAFLLVIACTTIAGASSAKRVNGVPVYGRTHDVAASDIRDAIKVGASHGSVFKAEVIGPHDINIYLRNLGYIRTFSSAAGWSFSHPYMYDPELLHLIRTATEVYVFPITTPLKPHREDKRMRLLMGQARRDIVRLLGSQENWYVGQYTIIHGDTARTSIGLLFRRGSNELILFFPDWGASQEGVDYAEGTFNGQYVADMLEQKPAKLLGRWSRQYAEPELAAK